MRADIHDGQEKNTPFKGRIQMRETSYLQIVTSSLHRTAGPYRCASPRQALAPDLAVSPPVDSESRPR
jgi:hypothetical protein